MNYIYTQTPYIYENLRDIYEHLRAALALYFYFHDVNYRELNVN